MHYYLYEIRNNLNGKIYVGVHKTKVLDDGYMGSGKVITRAIEKYGIENFTKTILEIFDSQEEMFAREKEIVTEEFLSREDTYNLRIGGLGGWDYLNDENRFSNKTHTIDHMIMMNRSAFAKHPRGGMCGKKHTESARNKMSESLKAIDHKGFLGKTHSEETKRKMGEKNSILQSGQKNSQFGSMWITNGIENKKIKKTEVIPDGWLKGRILK